MSEERERILAEIRAAAERAERGATGGAGATRAGRDDGPPVAALSHARRGRVGKGVVFRARRGVDRLPPSARAALVRRRHLKHVTINMGHLTDPALPRSARRPTSSAGSRPTGLPPGPAAGFDLDPLDPAAAAGRPGLAGGRARTTPTRCSTAAPTTTATSWAARWPRCGCGCAWPTARRCRAVGRRRAGAVRRAVPAVAGLRQPRHRPVRQGRAGRRAGGGRRRPTRAARRPRTRGAAGGPGRRLPAGDRGSTSAIAAAATARSCSRRR